MKLGIIGLPQSGKSTLFEAITQAGSSKNGESRLATVSVPDSRIDALHRMYNPKKTTYAQVEYMLPGHVNGGDGSNNDNPWASARDCDAWIQVVRNFPHFDGEEPTPEQDIQKLDQELVLSDLVVVEKRLERIHEMKSKRKAYDEEEDALLGQCREILEKETPLRHHTQMSDSPKLRGFTFLSAKPMLLVVNNEDDDETMPDLNRQTATSQPITLRGKLEHEISMMDDDDVALFMAEYQIHERAVDRVIQSSYSALGLISFFTVGEDEVKAWTIPADTAAVDAAEVIHSDIKKGFIRAEVVSYDDLMSARSYGEARNRGRVRLEGKTYTVQDGDIIDFRFNV